MRRVSLIDELWAGIWHQTVILTLLIGDGLVKRLEMYKLNEAASPTPLQACCLCWAWIATESLRGAWRAIQLFLGGV